MKQIETSQVNKNIKIFAWDLWFSQPKATFMSTCCQKRIFSCDAACGNAIKKITRHLEPTFGRELEAPPNAPLRLSVLPEKPKCSTYISRVDFAYLFLKKQQNTYF